MIITIVRFQKYLIGGYIIVSLAFLLFGSKCVQAYGVLGISCFLYFIYAIFSVAFLSPVGSDCPAFFQKSVALLLIKEKAAAVS